MLSEAIIKSKGNQTLKFDDIVSRTFVEAVAIISIELSSLKCEFSALLTKLLPDPSKSILSSSMRDMVKADGGVSEALGVTRHE